MQYRGDLADGCRWRSVQAAFKEPPALAEEEQEQDDERNRNTDKPKEKSATHNFLRCGFTGATTSDPSERFHTLFLGHVEARAQSFRQGVPTV